MTFSPALLHAVSPYDGFDLSGYPDIVHGWNSESGIFLHHIERLKPNLIVEVGSWLGKSAMHMARCLGVAGLRDTHIVCVDTWLGSLEWWTDLEDKARYQRL